MFVIMHPDDYIFVKFRKSTRKNKKYDAILMHKHTGRRHTVSFGDNRYEQYKDSTGVGAYTHKNHGDSERRRRYRLRHAKTAKKKFSPSWFAYKYLW